MPRYKKNFITEAIIRIDFKKSIVELKNVINEDLDKFILNYFPQKEIKNSFSEEIKLNPNSSVVERKRSEFKEWNYYANDKNKRFCITKDFTFISYKQYISYEDFTESFIEILKYIGKIYDVFSCRRFGMRYINNIRTEGNPTDWKDYINDSMISIFDIKPEDAEFTRVFHIVELSNNDIKTKLQFGMHNPDYPSVIKQKVFVLDLDSYKMGEINIDDLETLIPETHNIIEELFENSIKQPLKDIMNDE